MQSNTRLPAMERSPLQQAFDDYHRQAREMELLRASNTELRATNAALVAEAGMLREYLKTADSDRIRLQSIASTLLGRLLSINDTIAGAVKASIREGIDAAQNHAEGRGDLEQPAEATEEPAHTIQQSSAPKPAAEDVTPPVPSQRPARTILLAPVEFGR